jgi:hypothetical protein
VYKDRGLKLCNLTNGGEGASGLKRVFTQEHKDKLRDAKLNNPVRYWKDKKFNIIHRENLSKTHKGKQSNNKGKTFIDIYGKEKAKEIKDKIRKAQTSKKYSKSTNIKKGRVGEEHSRAKMYIIQEGNFDKEIKTTLSDLSKLYGFKVSAIRWMIEHNIVKNGIRIRRKQDENCGVN